MKPNYTWKIIAILNILMALFISPSSALPSINQTADKIFSESTSDFQYIHKIDEFINSNIYYVTTRGWAVTPIKTTWSTQRGDCSEIALIKTYMLVRNGIDAHVVYGTIPGIGLHDTVEIHVGAYRNIIDRWTFPKFEKLGDGLHPSEYLIEVNDND